MRSILLCLVALFAVGLVACDGGSDSGSPPDSGSSTPSGPKITIQGQSFSPASLTVDAGTTITIVNLDTEAHTVTSEAADNDFTPGAVSGVSFDTGQIAASSGGSNPPPYGGGGYLRSSAASSTVTITIPGDAPSGTVIPYFCQNHTNMMATPNGHISVR
jgi:plastocyanin